MRRQVAAGAAAVAAGAAGVYAGLVSGAMPVDLGLGRRSRPLGPLDASIRASRGVVFDVLAAPYLGRPTRHIQEKVRVLQRGADMVLAAHYTPVHRHLRATTVETVLLTRPERVEFRLVRGPVPHVLEQFSLQERPDGTLLQYQGEMGADLWWLGQAWSAVVARRWVAAVASTLAAVKAEAERREHVHG